jgi:hypothetical protein
MSNCVVAADDPLLPLQNVFWFAPLATFSAKEPGHFLHKILHGGVADILPQRRQTIRKGPRVCITHLPDLIIYHLLCGRL